MDKFDCEWIIGMMLVKFFEFKVVVFFLKKYVKSNSMYMYYEMKSFIIRIIFVYGVCIFFYMYLFFIKNILFKCIKMYNIL